MFLAASLQDRSLGPPKLISVGELGMPSKITICCRPVRYLVNQLRAGPSTVKSSLSLIAEWRSRQYQRQEDVAVCFKVVYYIVVHAEESRLSASINTARRLVWYRNVVSGVLPSSFDNFFPITKWRLNGG